MITGKRLKELVAQIPDDARVIAYEGEGVGIVIQTDDGRSGWIETGEKRDIPADESKHDLSEFARK